VFASSCFDPCLDRLDQHLPVGLVEPSLRDSVSQVSVVAVTDARNR